MQPTAVTGGGASRNTFGAGYSSLGYIQRLLLNETKIITGPCQILGLDCVMEGVARPALLRIIAPLVRHFRLFTTWCLATKNLDFS